MKNIQFYIKGSGMSGQAAFEAVQIIKQRLNLGNVLTPLFLTRDEGIKDIDLNPENDNMLVISSPHTHHAVQVKEAALKGFMAIFLEKPVCVDKADVGSLSEIKAPVYVLHGFRQSWGAQKIKEILNNKELGDIIAVEGCYHQSGHCFEEKGGVSWNNDIKFNGPFDVLLDLGAHWVDLLLYFMADELKQGSVELCYGGSPAPHRDSYAKVNLDFKGFPVSASFSKMVHGAKNNLAFKILGTKKSLSWNFDQDEEIIMGEKNTVSVIQRHPQEDRVSGKPPFHNLGWLEGYVEIIGNVIKGHLGQASQPVPLLKESLKATSLLLSLTQKKYN